MGSYSIPDAQLVAGISIAGYGLFVLISSLTKMQAVKKQWREKKDDVIYVFNFS